MQKQLVTSICLVTYLSAHASIAYFNGPAFTVPLDFTLVQPLDLDLNGGVDFDFFAGPSLTTGEPGNSYTPTYVSALSSNAVLARGANVAILPISSTIGANISNATWSTNDLNLASFATTGPQIVITPQGLVTNAPAAGWGGPLADAGSGFLAVQFSAPDGLHYGWIHASLQNTPTILDWAYETQPDTAILAGAAPTVAMKAPKIVRPGNLRLQWKSQPGTAYQIQYTTDLNTLTWSNLNFAVIATGNTTAVDLPLGSTFSFYRVLESK